MTNDVKFPEYPVEPVHKVCPRCLSRQVVIEGGTLPDLHMHCLTCHYNFESQDVSIKPDEFYTDMEINED